VCICIKNIRALVCVCVRECMREKLGSPYLCSYLQVETCSDELALTGECDAPPLSAQSLAHSILAESPESNRTEHAMIHAQCPLEFMYVCFLTLIVALTHLHSCCTATSTRADIATASPQRTASVSAVIYKVGSCIDVFWDEDEKWYPCVISKQANDVDGTTASLCAYDDGIGRWHNLQEQECRPTTPTVDRLKKLSIANLRHRLEYESVPLTTTLRKSQLVNMLIKKFLSAHSTSDKAAIALPTTTVAAANVTQSATNTIPVTSPKPINAPAAVINTVQAAREIINSNSITLPSPATTPSRSCVDSILAVKAKFGQTHAERMQMKRQLREERALQLISNQRADMVVDTRQTNSSSFTSQNHKLTASEACARIESHAMALRTLSSRGNRSCYNERDGYNFITIKQSDLSQWGGKHVWRAGDSDMSLLPSAVTMVYDVSGWKCVNTLADSDGVVFERPSPPLIIRGSGATGRRRHFVWTTDMSIWLHYATKSLPYKSIPFVSLCEEAENKWGYRAPQVEHLENKIKSRDQAEKAERVVKWVKDALKGIMELESN